MNTLPQPPGPRRTDIKMKRPLAGPPIAFAIRLRITGLASITRAGLLVNQETTAPFHDKGGPVKAYQTFGKDLDGLLKELNEVLAA